MPRNAAGYAFHEWTPERKAKFVDLRLQGMHTHWAVFWALIDRVNSAERVYSAEAVMKYWLSPLEEYLTTVWSSPMHGADNRHMPPQELFDALAAAEGDQLEETQ